MKKISADIIYPVTSSPIENGTVILNDNGVVVDVVRERLSDSNYISGAIVPGFVNSHCHLELSYLKNKMPEQTGLDDFIKQIEEKRKVVTDREIEDAIIDAENEMMQNGIVAVGDISNDAYSFTQKKKNNLYYHTFIEVLGFHPDRAEGAFAKAAKLYAQLDGQAASITPHAPYSASEKLLHLVADHALQHHSIITMHNQENADEDQMFKMGVGKIIERLRAFGINTDHFKPTGTTSIQSVMPYILKAKKILLVHNTFTSKQDIDWLKLYAMDKVFLCVCPNANLYIENTLPDITMLAASGLPITIGTDSLASNHELNILAEMQTMLKKFPALTFEQVLTWATLNGAKYLGVDDKFGSIEKNKTPGLIQIQECENQMALPKANTKSLRIL